MGCQTINGNLHALHRDVFERSTDRAATTVAEAADRPAVAVCHILDNLRSGVGVTQIVNDLMTSGDMAATGLIVHDTHVSPMFEPLLEDGRLTVATTVWGISKAILAARRRGTRLLHVHSRRNAWIGVLSKMLGYRVVRSQHFGSVAAPKRALRTTLRNLLTFRTFWVDRWIAVSETSKDYIRHRWQIPSERISVIPNGIDISRFAPRSPAERAATRAQIGIDDNATVFVSLGALVERKRHDAVLEAFARASKGHPEARLLIVGEGSKRATLEQAIADLNLEGRAILLGLRHDVPEILAASDALVHGAVDEAFGLAVAEALACGIPAIVCGNKGPAEIVKHSRTGLVVEKGNPDALIDAMSLLLREPGLRRQLGQTGRDFVTDHLSKSRMLREHFELYRRLLETGRVPTETPR